MGNVKMDFEGRFMKVLADHGATIPSLAKALDMPKNTLRYRSKNINSWNIVDFLKLSSILRLTDEEVNFLTLGVE